MGMLETRNLDFEELISLGVNEGTLPSNAHTPSNFTFDIRRAFGLACHNERDAVTAYHFYRLIQRAKKVYLIYNQDTTGFGGGEVSRYVQQLEMEAPPNIKIRKWGVEQKILKANGANEISIAKGEREVEKLIAQSERGFSPSALNTYRSCSLKFYFRYVAGFKEDSKLNEEVDHATFGTAVHDTLDSLYKTYLGEVLGEAELKSLMARMENELLVQFTKQVSANKLKSGKNLLAFEVARSYVNRVLKHDLKTIKSGKTITAISLEQELSRTIHVNSGESQYAVKIKGLADRIDKLHDGSYRLIDYKTGSIDKQTLIKNESMLEQTKSDNAFQLLLYAWMYAAINSETLELHPTVYFLRSKEIEKPITVELEKVSLNSAERIEFTEKMLVELLEEVFNPELNFTQTTKTDACKYCDFKQVCQR
jgi:CRISPR/Cas system-associated exonuclease Cas4 (RecB family)